MRRMCYYCLTFPTISSTVAQIKVYRYIKYTHCVKMHSSACDL